MVSKVGQATGSLPKVHQPILESETEGQAIEWRKVNGWDYEVSSDGRVRGRSGLKSTWSVRGYRGLGLKSNGMKKRTYVHTLVAEAFLGPRPPGLEINHKDGDPTNNNVLNLEYITHKDNQRHASRIGKLCSGERHPLARLKNSDVYEIVASELSDKEAAALFGVSGATVARVRSGKTWKAVTGLKPPNDSLLSCCRCSHRWKTRIRRSGKPRSLRCPACFSFAWDCSGGVPIPGAVCR